MSKNKSQGFNLADFEWPEFNSDSKRIKAYSKRYKGMSISEAFSQHYNLNLNPSENVDFVPQDLRVGDVIKTRILSIDKSKVVFDMANYKANIQSSVNLYKYERFKTNLPLEELDVVVVKVDKDRVLVDPIAPMIENWMGPILKNPNIQKIVPNESTGAMPQPITVKDLRLTGGGFVGKAVIPNASRFVNEDYTMDAFIPGSQIVLNITDNFEQFNGKSVQTFIVNYMMKPGASKGDKNNMSLVCSAKELIKFNGELTMIQLFGHWCEESDYWKSFKDITFKGKVTGVINTSKKCGVFVEIPELSITGMVAKKPEELVGFKPHTEVAVKLTGFDEETFFDPYTQQVQHVIPYEIEDGLLKKCNLKPILELV